MPRGVQQFVKQIFYDGGQFSLNLQFLALVFECVILPAWRIPIICNSPGIGKNNKYVFVGLLTELRRN